jgi:hypothetical protein
MEQHDAFRSDATTAHPMSAPATEAASVGHAAATPTSAPSAASLRPRSAAGWLVLGLVAGTCATLAVLLTSGLSFADEAGQPFGAPAVSITPASSITGIPSTPGDDLSDEPTSGPPVVVGAPPPVTVSLEDGGKGDKGKNGSDGANGNSGNGGSGSGSGGTGSNGSGSGSSGSNGSGGSGSNGSGSSGSGSSGSGASGSGSSGGSGGSTGSGSSGSGNGKG